MCVCGTRVCCGACPSDAPAAAAAGKLPLPLDPQESTVGISLLSVICLRLHGSHCVSLSVCKGMCVCVCVRDCPRRALVIVPRSYV